MKHEHSVDRTSELVFEFVIRRISSAAIPGVLRYLWDWFYLFAGPFIGQRKWLFFLLLSLILPIWSAFMFWLTEKNIFLSQIISSLIMCMIICQIGFSPNHNHLVFLKSRRHLFLRAVFRTVVVFSFVVLVFGVSILISLVLQKVPSFQMMGKDVVFVPFDASILLAPALVIPLAGSILIFFKKNLFAFIVFFSTMCIVVTITLSILSIINHNNAFPELWLMLPILASSWAIHLWVLYYDNIKRSIC